MNSGMRPIRYPLDVSMFQGIQMHIIDVALVVGVVTDEMLPIMPRPYATFPGCFSYV
jgi:hypothetical protein